MSEEQRSTMEIPDDMKLVMHQTWLPALMTSVLEAVKRLPQAHRETVLREMCTTCEDMAMAGAVGIQPGMSWDDYLKYLKEAVPPIGPWTVTQDGDDFNLVYDATVAPDGKPRCHCPLLQLGIIKETVPFCCDSGARLSAKMIAGATNRSIVKAEVIDSPVRTGAPVCHYRVRTKPGSST